MTDKNILNKKEIDDFLWVHRNNGCYSIKDKDDINIFWVDSVTGEKIKIIYKQGDI